MAATSLLLNQPVRSAKPSAFVPQLAQPSARMALNTKPVNHGLFYFHLLRYTCQIDNTEAKDMAAKKKQAEQPTSDELQQILEHFGENSAEYAEAKAKAEKE